MKIIRHTARDMRGALRAVREQLGEDAVILSSRRTGEGVEVTAAVDFDASTLEAGGFTGSPGVATLPAPSFTPPPGPALTQPTSSSQPTASSRSAIANNPTVLALTAPRGAKAKPVETAPAPTAQPVATPGPAPSYDVLAAIERMPGYSPAYDELISEAARQAVSEHSAGPRIAAPHVVAEPRIAAPAVAVTSAPAPVPARGQAAAGVAAAAQAMLAPVAAAARALSSPVAAAPAVAVAGPTWTYEPPTDALPDTDPVAEVREATLTPLASNEVQAAFAQFQTPAAPAPGATDAMGSELKTLRRMLETQLAHLAWNDLNRRAPVHSEILRELTEIGITQDLAEHLARQLPEDADITFARRFTIAGLSQYLKVTGDHWLDDGGRVAFAGATGVGKTTTLAKFAVRWVLRHGPRDIALVAADTVRIGAQDQLQSLAQLLGVSVYTPEKFESLPSLLSSLNERLILIDTPGSSVRDPQLANRLAVLSNVASKLQTALVLAASTQAGAIEESVKHFAPANPSCCVLTKLDEAASLGGVLSVLIRARLPVSYMSEGQRVPEDLRPARALELVSAAVRLAKARGAAADEDLLRRRFGKTAHGIS